VNEIKKIDKKLENENEYVNDFFKSKEKEFLFYLTKLDGKQRNILLGITEEHYNDKNLAKQWYRDIAKLVHPDKDGTNKAFSVLNELYKIMIDDEE